MAVQEIYRMVLDFKQDEIQGLVQTEIDAGTEVSSILNDGLIAAMTEVGYIRGFFTNDIYLGVRGDNVWSFVSG